MINALTCVGLGIAITCGILFIPFYIGKAAFWAMDKITHTPPEPRQNVDSGDVVITWGAGLFIPAALVALVVVLNALRFFLINSFSF